MAGWIALMGGDEFSAGCEDMDRNILKVGVKDPRVVVVPTAAAGQDPLKAASNGVGYFLGLGFEAFPLMVIESVSANDNDFLDVIDTADVIYLTGGDPGHLLTTLRGSLFLKKLLSALRRGATVVGSSAAAMVMGSWVRLNGVWVDALGILPDVVLLPHHERNNPVEIAGQLTSTYPDSAIVIGLDSMTCCFGGLTGWTVLGVGDVTVYYPGGWKSYRKGMKVDLSFCSRS